jgi:MOSC domain-containing protein YiiM
VDGAVTEPGSGAADGLPAGRVVSLNVGVPQPLMTPGNVEVLSGIVKVPVTGRRRVVRHNVDGDGQADPRVHGGEMKAVYAYPYEHYGFWSRELPRQGLPMGLFGENLTTEGLVEADVRIGDRFGIGTALLEVTQPRQPCFKLAAHIGRPDFPKLFARSGRSGWYLRVVEEGEIGAGDWIVREVAGAGPTVLELFRETMGGE